MLIQEMSNPRFQKYPVWSFEHFFAFSIYLTFVWGLAFIRDDYLWIIGDDPNLLQQSILITKGFIPNVDYFSGYPGLSLQLHALIIKLFGEQPLTQHIYSAFLATLLGIVFFGVARSVKPWLVLLILIFVYSQGQLLNPTPNPGFLFEVAFIIGLKKSFDFFESQNLTDALLVGVFFAISFLAKQYGIFGPVSFFVASIVLLNFDLLKQKIALWVALLAISGSILYVYFGGLIPNDNDQNILLLKNASLFILPTLAGLISASFLKSNKFDELISISLALRANLIVSGVFLGLVTLYLLTFYGSDLFVVVHEIMISAPRRINGALVPVVFSQDTGVRIVYGLLIVFLPFAASHMSKDRDSSIICAVITACIGFLLFKTGNLSATPFISIAFVMLVVVAFFYLKGGRRRRVLAMLAGFSPCFLILIPYPNFAYHIPILMFFVLLLYAPDNLRESGLLRSFLSFKGLLPYIVTVLIIGNAIFNTSNEMNNYKNYSFKEINFRSGDLKWVDVIEEAHSVESGVGQCATYACRYLLLTMPGFNDYSKIIENPISKHN